MGLPHQLIALFATADLLTTSFAALRLGLLPLENAPAFVRHAIEQVTGQPSTWDKLTKSAVGHALKVSSPPPRKLLFVIVAVCLVRCSAILSIWGGIVKTVARVRAGGQTEDFSERAIAYSAVCIISMLVNLSMLNMLFQTHEFISGRPDTSVSGILKQLNSSSLAAEQLIVSAAEWVLFILFVGTNKSLMASPPPSTAAAPLAIATPVSADSQGGETDTVDAKSPKKDYGALGETPQPSTESELETNATVQQDSVDSQNVGETSLDSENVASTSEQQTLTGDATPSDIVDVPSDRKKGMQDAKDRLQRARENGKVRRRSLWKKIRGKASLGNNNNVDETNS